MLTAVIVLAILLGVFIILLISWMFWFFLYYKKKNIKNIQNNDKQSANETKYFQKLAELQNLSIDELKEKSMAHFKDQYKHDLAIEYKKIKAEFDLNYQTEANEILLTAMQRNPEDLVGDYSTTTIKVEDESLKPRIIGRDGRNKKAFELLTGVDLVIEKDSPFISLSSLNQIRRQIANNLLIRLIEIKYIDPLKIETTYQEILENFKQDTTKIGKHVVEDILKVYNLDHSIYYYVGLLKYRSSYGQNNLDHSIECAFIASSIAKSLNLDSEKAKLCAFFHDIGKSIDFEINKDHVLAGIEIAETCHLPIDVIHAIHAHHGAVPTQNEYAVITKIADKISASRPGSRNDSYQEYFERVSRLEEICKEFNDVKKAYVLRSGRYLMVLVKKSIKSEAELELLVHDIKKRIEDDPVVKNYKIMIEVIQELKKQTETNVLITQD